MRKLLPVFISFFLLSVTNTNAQSGFTFSCTRDTSIDCSQSCVSLEGLIPDVHSIADDYTVSKVVSNDGSNGCFPAAVRLDIPGTSTNLEIDDEFTPVILLPPNFFFPFYGQYYDRLVVSVNGMITFDDTETGFSNWVINSNLPNNFYARACIMGVFQDINIFETTSPTRQVKYDVLGVAPNRRWVLTFYKIPLFQCDTKINNSYQIVLYEGLGLIDVFVKERDICPGWNSGRAMIGIQNYDWTKGLMAPGRTGMGPAWSGTNLNETWRFTPKTGPSLFKKVELVDMGGSVVATGDTVGAANSNLKVFFNNVCPTATTKYVVKSTYYNYLYFLDPASWPTTDKDSLVFGLDTVTIFKNGSIPSLNVTTTQAQCGANPNGSITVTAPVGANYEYSIDVPSGYQLSNTFSVPPGTYTVTVHDITGTCTKDTTVTITAPTTLTGSAVSTNSSCPGASNATITATGSLGSGSYTYDIDAGATPTFPNNTGIFPNQTDGVHTIFIRDGAGCIYSFSHTVNADPIFTTTANSVNATCLGATNGSITVTVPSSGQAPFEYSLGINVTPVATNTNFPNLAGDSTYTINVEDGAGCLYTFTHNVGYDPGVTSAVTIRNASCDGVNNGRIILTPSGGTPLYQFRFDTVGSPPNSPIFLPLDTIRNLRGSRFYNVNIRDNIGCLFNIDSIYIDKGTGVTATFDIVNSVCSAASTGRIITNITTIGTPPYEVSVNNGVFNPLDTIRNLAPGNYFITIRDAAGCTFTPQRLSVGTDDPGISATFTTKATACEAALTGQVYITPTSGVGPYFFNLDNSGTPLPLNDTIRGLDTGFHSILLTDALGCNITLDPEITAGPGVSATATPFATACAAATTGKIYVEVTAGIAPFTYLIDGTGPFPLTDTLRNLDSGIHVIEVRDAVGCSKILTADVPFGTGVSATATPIATACATATTGKIYVEVTAGVAPFRYRVDNPTGAFVPLNDTLRNLDSGIHVIEILDAVGCSITLRPDVPIGPGVSATATPFATACATATTGKIFVEVTAGFAPFVRNLDNTGFVPLNDTLRNLDSGIHVIEVRDAVGCSIILRPDVTFGVGVTATTKSINAACLGVSTGQIVVSPTTGVPPFTYTVDGILPAKPLDTIKGLASGNYTIDINDAVGCSLNLPSVGVNDNVGVTATFATVNSACATASTGAIIVSPLTGTRGFVYSRDGGATTQADSVFRNLAANPYTITITDAVGCELNSPLQNVGNNPGVLTNPSTIQNSSCASIPNGTITVNVTAGIAPYIYQQVSPTVGTPQSSNQFTSLFSGPYDITIADSAGCTQTITSVVGSNPKVQFDSLSIVRPTCNGLLNGTIKVNISLGVPPYQYAIDNISNYGASNIFSNVGAGPHTLYVKDANNCAIDTAIIISEPTALGISLTGTTPATCSGNPDGSIAVNANGGTSPYQYTLDAAGLTGYQALPSFGVLQGNNYAVTVRDTLGCTASVTNIVVGFVSTMYLDLGNDTTICAEQPIVLSPNTNPETNIFSYSNGASLDADNIKNPSATPLSLTTYTLTATWGLCTLTDNIRVDVKRKPVPEAGPEVIICHDTTTVLTASASNLSGTVNYTWSPASLIDTRNLPAGAAVADTTTVTVRPIDQFTYFKVNVTDNYGCNFNVADSVLVNMLPPVYAFAGNDTNAVLNAPHQLTATGAGANGTYVWGNPPAGVTISDGSIFNPIATFTPVPEPGSFHPDTNYYRLSVTATNAAGCFASDTIKINVFVGPTCYVPNAFAPEGINSANRIFRPVPVGVNIEYFRVFNRYGEAVFETSRFMQGWDGMYKGKPQPIGAYAWVVKGKDRKGRELIMKGTVMLVR